MWTDMSAIVRPTRDGIHGREFISTSVDIGPKPAFLTFNEQALATGERLRTLSIPIPVLFDVPPSSVLSTKFLKVLVEAAQEVETLLVLPVRVLNKFALHEQQSEVRWTCSVHPRTWGWEENLTDPAGSNSIGTDHGASQSRA
jgi:hypothetical protein